MKFQKQKMGEDIYPKYLRNAITLDDNPNFSPYKEMQTNPERFSHLKYRNFCHILNAFKQLDHCPISALAPFSCKNV